MTFQAQAAPAPPRAPRLSLSPSAETYPQRRSSGGRAGKGETAPARCGSHLPAARRRSERDDSWEREADRIADQVATTPEHGTISRAPLRIQRLRGDRVGAPVAVPQSVDRTLASCGSPLEPEVRREMEWRFGHDFSRVRVHAGPAAAQSASDVNAHAYTVGDHLVFGPDRFAPRTPAGRHLLAHELTHVVQQAGGGIASLQRKAKENEDSWPTLVAAGERLARAPVGLYRLEPYEGELLEIIEPTSKISGLGHKVAAEGPIGAPEKKIQREFKDYAELQETLRTFETSLVSQLRQGAEVLLDATEAKLKLMYARYIGKGPHLDWLQNVQEGYPQHGPGWIQREIEELNNDPDVVALRDKHALFQSSLDREEREAGQAMAEAPSARDPRSPAFAYFDAQQKERARRRQQEQQKYNESLLRVLRSKSRLSFLPGFDVSAFLNEKNGGNAQNKLIRFVEDAGGKVREARQKLGSRRFLYGADILIETLKGRLAEQLGQSPDLNRSVAGEDPILGPLSREAESSRRADTVNWIVDKLARERKAESATLWERIVTVLEVLSSFVPGPIGWGIRVGVAAAGFDLRMGRAAEQRLLHGTELSAVAADPNAGLKAVGEFALQVGPDAALSLGTKGATRLAVRSANVERSAAIQATRGGERAATSPATAVREGQGSLAEAAAARAAPPTAAPAPIPRRRPAPPATEEAFGARAGGRISATDRGKGARPFYMTDPRPPRTLARSRAPEVLDEELVGIGAKGPRYRPAPPPTPDPYANYIAARDSGIRSAGLGPNQVPHYAENVGPSSAHLVGRRNGFMSPDGTRGWRLDYSPNRGGHINWWRTEAGVEYRGSTAIWGADEATFFKLLQGHFGMPPS